MIMKLLALFMLNKIFVWVPAVDSGGPYGQSSHHIHQVRRASAGGDILHAALKPKIPPLRQRCLQ